MTAQEACGGVELLHRLWAAGYSLRLVPASRPRSGWSIIPMGAAGPSGELLELYDRHHDEAVERLLEACRLARIKPKDWHLVGEWLRTSKTAKENADECRTKARGPARPD